MYLVCCRHVKQLNLTIEAMSKNANDVAIQLKQSQSAASDAKHLEERLEEELSQREKLLNVVISMSNKIQSHCDNSYLTDDDTTSLV